MEVVVLSLRQDGNNNEGTDLVIMAGAAPSPRHGEGAAQKTHLTRKRATIGFCAREIKGPAFPIWLACTLIDTLQGLPSINKSVFTNNTGLPEVKKRRKEKRASVSTSHTALDISLR